MQLTEIKLYSAELDYKPTGHPDPDCDCDCKSPAVPLLLKSIVSPLHPEMEEECDCKSASVPTVMSVDTTPSQPSQSDITDQNLQAIVPAIVSILPLYVR